MKAIVMNTTKSKLDKRMEAITLKTGFLLCDEVYTAGNTNFEMFFKETGAGFSMEKKLTLLESWNRNDPEALDMLHDVKEALKLAKKIKHKQTDHIVFLRSMEKSISDMVNNHMQEFEDNMNEAGFQSLKELSEKGAIKSYRFGYDNEVPVEGVTASGLLQRLLPSLKEDEEPEIFFLGNEFFQSSEGNVPHCAFASPEASDVQNTVLQHCFTFPNVNALSSSEMETVHKQLFQSGSAFKENADEWIDTCYFDERIAVRNHFFVNNLLPSAARLQKNIDQNEILKLCSRLQNDAVKLHVWLGEIPVWTLWQHYRKYNTIGDETWHKLEALQEADAYRNERWPVAVISVPHEPFSDNPDNNNSGIEIKQTKKYIAID